MDALLQINQLQVALNEIENGHGKYLNMDNMPKQFTPEYIYGYSNEEKQIKYNQFFDMIKLIRQKLKEKQEEILNSRGKNTNYFVLLLNNKFLEQKKYQQTKKIE